MLDPFLDRPLALEIRAARQLLTSGEPRVSRMTQASLGEPPVAPPGDSGYDLVGGVAVIGVYGVLLANLGTRRPWGQWATGYDGIRANLAAALEDTAVRAIVLHIDSPGGVCVGLFDLADALASAGSVKPVIAICEQAYSAAYALACAAGFITVSQTGGVGSIGVITALTDVSRMLEKAGIGVHFVYFGAKKAVETRASVTGVTDDVLADLQREVDRLGEMFVDVVAQNRGLTAEAVRGTEAACFMGSDAVAVGLADRVCSADAAFTAVLADLGAA